MTRADDKDAGEQRLLWPAIRRAERILTAQDLEALQSAGIGLTEYAALMGLDGGSGRSSADMARCLSVSAQTAHTVVVQLEEGGFVERNPDAFSDRILVNCLTPQGRKLFSEASTALDQLEQDRIRAIGKDDHAFLIKALDPAVRFGEENQREAPSDEAHREFLAGHLGTAIRNVHKQASWLVIDAMKASGTGLTLSQALVLEALCRKQELPIQRAATLLCIPQQTVSHAMHKLEQSGYVNKRIAPGHKSLKLYAPSTNGTAIHAGHAGAIAESVQTVIDTIDAPMPAFVARLEDATGKLQGRR